ncbi:MAG: hypothetical protein IJI46_03365 [Erysipelotrichaceae bacterium]|nr:hypothetical protein [Erysipelotrichaceae bacterium]
MNLIRNLLGFVIIMSLLPITMLAFDYTADLPFEYSEISDELCLAQLREMLLISYDLQFSERALYFTYGNKDASLSLIGDKLILHPGTQIFLAQLDDLYFEERNGVIYVCYQRKNKNYERAILCARGFYLDAFSDCDVGDDLPDRSEE